MPAAVSTALAAGASTAVAVGGQRVMAERQHHQPGPAEADQKRRQRDPAETPRGAE
jgi:hypothetical protein